LRNLIKNKFKKGENTMFLHYIKILGIIIGIIFIIFGIVLNYMDNDHAAGRFNIK